MFPLLSMWLGQPWGALIGLPLDYVIAQAIMFTLCPEPIRRDNFGWLYAIGRAIRRA